MDYPRFPDTYYHRTLKNCRVKFGKTVVRVEAKSSEGRWLLLQSFLLTKQHELALALLRDSQTLSEAVAAMGTRTTALEVTP